MAPKRTDIISQLDKDQLDTLHHIYDYYSKLGMSHQDIAGIAANIFKESSFRHNSRDLSGYHGYVQMSPDMQQAVINAYGNLNPDTQLQFVYDQITGNSKVKGYTNGAGYQYGKYKTGGDAAEAFRSTFERNKAGRQQSRIDYGNQFYDYFNQRSLKQKVGQQPKPIVLQPVSTTVRQTIPAEQTRYTWTGVENEPSYVTGKPILKLQPRIQLPSLVEMMEDSEWEPPFLQLKPSYKDGKLPKFKDGTRYISNKEGGWDRITDDNLADVFANFVVTPKGSKKEESVNRLSEYDRKMRQQLHNAGYPTGEMLESDARNRYLTQLQGKGELPLQQTSPEFDLLLLGASTPFRTGRQLRKIRALSKEMNEVFDEGLRHANSKSPWVYDASQVVNPDHVVALEKSGNGSLVQTAKQAGQNSTAQELIGETANRQLPRLNPKLSASNTKSSPYDGVPEADYDGPIPKTTIRKIGPDSKLSLPEPKYSKYVDSEGNINVRNVVSAIREFYKKHPEARKYKDIINSSGTLDQHIAAVVKSAQEAPVPEGYTRQQLVQAALFHDIGKTLDPTKTHDKKSVEILKELGIEVSPEVENAIGRHMSSHLGNKDALSKALHFVDVARGENMESAMKNYSYLGYPGMNNSKIKPLYKNDTRWQLQNIINPILDRYGYYFTNDEYKKYGINNYVEGDPVIPLDVSPEIARAMVLDKVRQHRTFVRSMYEANGRDWDRLRKQTAQQLGKDPKDITNEEMFRNAAQYIKRHDTNSGTMGLDEYLEQYELNPKDYQALYTSSRDATAAGYRSGSKPGDSTSYLLQMDINDNPNWSLAELWANNEFPVVYSNVYVNQGTNWRNYELPFRLNTGLDLEKEYKSISQDNINYNRNAEVNAQLDADRKTTEYFEQHPEELNTGLTYFKDTKPTTFLQANYKRSENSPFPGIGFNAARNDIQYWDTTDQYIVDPNNGRQSSSRYLQGTQYRSTGDNIGRVPGIENFVPTNIARINNVLKDVGLSEVYPIMSSDVKTGDLNVKYPRAYTSFSDLVYDIDQMYNGLKELDTDEGLFKAYLWDRGYSSPPDWMDVDKIKSAIKNGMGDRIRNKHMLNLLSTFYKRGMLSKKQIDAVNKELRSGKNMQEVFDKYASKKQMLQRAKNTYFSDIKQARKKDSFVRRKRLQEEIAIKQSFIRAQKRSELYKAPVLKPVKSKAQFMKDYGVEPDYSYMSPDGYRVFSTERLDNPDPNDIYGNHFVIVGPRGSKQLSIVGDWDPTVKSKSHRHGGNYIPGTSRNLGAIGAAITAGSATLAPRKKKKK